MPVITLAKQAQGVRRVLRPALRGACRRARRVPEASSATSSRSPTTTTSRRSTASTSPSATGTPTQRTFKYVGSETDKTLSPASPDAAALQAVRALRARFRAQAWATAAS